jgi:predicted dehydrogenase
MKDLKIGVIGLGIGRMHIQRYLTHPGAKVVAAADLNQDRVDLNAKEFGLTGYTDAEEMLAKEKLDIVSVCTPNKFHKDLTIKALQSGAHVLCEKPMAMNSDEAREMLLAAKTSGKRLGINFSYRFSDQSWALKSIVDEGILGEIYYARTIWHRRRGMPGFGGWFGQKALSGGGPLIDLGVHRLDLALWLMGYPKPKWVMGSAYNPIATELAARQGLTFDVEDMAAGMIKFENGATLSVEASWAANIKELELMETRLLGTKAGLVQRNKDEGYNFEAELYMERAGANYDMKLHPPVAAAKPAQWYFVDALLNDYPFIATGEQGLIVQELLDAIYTSSLTGEPVQIGA